MHYTKLRALEKLDMTMEEFISWLEYFTYKEKIPLVDICRIFPEVSRTFVERLGDKIDFIYLSDSERNARVIATYNNEEKRKQIVSQIKNKLVGRKREEWEVERIRDGCKGRVISQKQRDKISQTLKQKRCTKEWREKQSERVKTFYSGMTAEEKRVYLKNFIKAGHRSDKRTKIELKVSKQLNEMGIKFIQQKRVVDKNGKTYFLDFYIPSMKTVIECNGDYWHSLDERKERDKRLKRYVEDSGRKILFIWEHEIKDEWFWIGDYL